MMQTGTIIEIRDCGSIVMVILRSAKGWLVPICFDHRSFCYLLENEHSRAAQLVGRPACFNGERLTFLDTQYDRT
jgi:hypothetical protein